MKKLLVISLFLLSGCATTGAMNDIHEGMSRTDIVSKLGSPNNKSLGEDGTECLNFALVDVYTLFRQPFHVCLRGDKVVFFGSKWK